MLAIRMQRVGRRGHAQFRVIVQDSRFHPKRGKVVAYLGSYDPHTKTAAIDKDAAKKYLDNGAQPSDRIAKLLKSEGVKLPAWVIVSEPGKRATRNPEKLRRNRPAEEAAAEPTPETPAQEPAATEAEKPAEAPDEAAAAEETKPAAEDSQAEQPASEAPAAEEPAENSPTES